MTIDSPTEYGLANSYPNPGNPGTSISFQMPETGLAVLKVYNVRGEVVRTLKNGQFSSGSHKVYWNGRNDFGGSVGTGMYIFVLETGGKVFNRKYSLIK